MSPLRWLGSPRTVVDRESAWYPLVRPKMIKLARGKTSSCFCLVACVAATSWGISLSAIAVTPDLIRPAQLAPYGLEIAWFNQVQMDPSRGRIAEWTLDRGTLFVVTDTAVLQAFDAETGRSLWATTVGSADLLTLRPTAGEHLVAVVNGSTIYILNRHTGVILWKRQTEGAVGAGPLLSPTRVFIPLIRGKIEAYRYEWETPEMAVAARGVGGTETPSSTDTVPAPASAATPVSQGTPSVDETSPQPPAQPIAREELRLARRRAPVLFAMSWGHAFVEPRLTYADFSRERVAWPTDRGLLFVAEADARTDSYFQVRYFLQANGDIVAPPCVRPGDPKNPNDPNRMLFVATTNGFVHALREYDGKQMWRFSTAEPINRSPALIGDDLYFSTQTGGLYRVKATTGDLVWFSRGIRQFVAASDQRVYAVNGLNQLVIMDIQTGARLGQIDVTRFPLRYMNMETDRIYLADETGLIQCVREARLTKPIRHTAPPSTSPPAKPQPQLRAPEAQPTQPQPTPKPPGQPQGENPFE